MAVRRLLWAPGELGLARAFVAGDLDIDGDIFVVLDALAPHVRRVGRGRIAQALPAALLAARRLGIIGGAPKPPPEEHAGRGAAALASGATPRPSPTTTTSATTSTASCSGRR